MPDPNKLLITLRQAIVAFRSTPGRSGRVVRLPQGAEVMVVGDLHGNVENFRSALRRAALDQHPQRHLILQEVVHGPFRYDGGGDKSHQLLDLVAALKCQYPARVHFILGNHELAQWQDQRIGKGDVDQNEVFKDGIREAYGPAAADVEAVYNHLLASANLLVRAANRVLVCHTIPPRKHLDNFDPERLEHDELTTADLSLGGTVHSLVWGRDHSQQAADAFLHKMDADLAVCGHIPSDQGHQVPNSRMLILDAVGTPACYCLFPTDRPLSQQELLAGLGYL
jgi:hypothetical protein